MILSLLQYIFVAQVKVIISLGVVDSSLGSRLINIHVHSYM